MPTRRQTIGGLIASPLAVNAGLAGQSASALGSARTSQATPAPATPATGTPAAGRPTVVLVHGAFADASGWAGVISRLDAEGIAVVAVANPLRGISADAAYVTARVAAIEGPVVLVGHSYGGAVITVTGAQAPNAVGLVYVSALALDEGETLMGFTGQYTDNLLGPALRPVTVPVPGGSGTQTEFTVDVASFQDVFCADLPAEQARTLALTQRPLADTAFGEPNPAAAWKTLPSWFVVSTQDRAIDPAAERAMAERAGSTTIELEASHVAFISQPDAVAELIMSAVDTVG